jgi:Spy/CpxP family protein refolding chaperone
MRTGKFIFFTILISGLLVASGLGQRKDRDRFMMKDRIIENLNLTEEQQTKISEMRLENQKEMVDYRAELEKKQLEMKELKLKGNYSRSDYLAKTSEIGKIKNKIEEARARHQMDMYELLDADQKKIWNEKSFRYTERKPNFRSRELRRSAVQD